MKKKMRLGEILIEQGVLNTQNLERALEKQKSEGGLLGEVLLKMGIVKEEDIVIALAEQFNIPYLPIQNCVINPKILQLIPADIAKKYFCIPIDKINNVITVIMVDPSNEFARQEIEKVTGCRIQGIVGTASEIVQAIKKYYKISGALCENISLSDKISKLSFHSQTETKKK